MNRALRLNYLQRLFYKNPRGYRSSELAEMCGVDQRTINRDLLDLQGEPFYLPLDMGEEWRYRLAGDGFRIPVHLSLQEAAALYLAARLLDRLCDEPNPYVGRALLALAEALPEVVGQQIQRIASSQLREDESAYARVFAAVTRAWAMGRKVHVRYRGIHSAEEREFDYCPYLIEPSSVGYAAYVIGHASYCNALRTLKLERISHAELLDEAFLVPDDFDPTALLSRAWGVMYGDELVPVALRFTPQVARRVKESVWHESQKVEDCADGGCILRVQVAHTLEMKPWIRGWGAECEVLEPKELRQEIAAELRRAAGVYEE